MLIYPPGNHPGGIGVGWCGKDGSTCQCLSGKACGGVPGPTGARWTHGIGGGTSRTARIMDVLGIEWGYESSVSEQVWRVPELLTS